MSLMSRSALADVKGCGLYRLDVHLPATNRNSGNESRPSAVTAANVGTGRHWESGRKQRLEQFARHCVVASPQIRSACNDASLHKRLIEHCFSTWHGSC